MSILENHKRDLKAFYYYIEEVLRENGMNYSISYSSNKILIQRPSENASLKYIRILPTFEKGSRHFISERGFNFSKDDVFNYISANVAYRGVTVIISFCGKQRILNTYTVANESSTLIEEGYMFLIGTIGSFNEIKRPNIGGIKILTQKEVDTISDPDKALRSIYKSWGIKS